MNPVPESVLNLIASGRKIEAIKEVRASTGMGLREAKETVEALERGETPLLPSDASTDPNALATRVLALVENGQTLQAIKEVRNATGADLRDAKQLVDQISQDVQPNVVPLQTANSRQSARLVVIAALIVALMGFVIVWLVGA